MSNVLAIAQRIPQRDGYSRCLQAASFSNPAYKVFYKNNSLGYARIGIVVSKKQFKLAVLRNCNKRLVREVFRQHVLRHRALDLVVMVRFVKVLSLTQRKQYLVNLFNQLEQHAHCTDQTDSGLSVCY